MKKEYISTETATKYINFYIGNTKLLYRYILQQLLYSGDKEELFLGFFFMFIRRNGKKQHSEYINLYTIKIVRCSFNISKLQMPFRLQPSC